jgi:hypothetical protein
MTLEEYWKARFAEKGLRQVMSTHILPAVLTRQWADEAKVTTHQNCAQLRCKNAGAAGMDTKALCVIGGSKNVARACGYVDKCAKAPRDT